MRMSTRPRIRTFSARTSQIRTHRASLARAIEEGRAVLSIDTLDSIFPKAETKRHSTSNNGEDADEEKIPELLCGCIHADRQDAERDEQNPEGKECLERPYRLPINDGDHQEQDADSCASQQPYHEFSYGGRYHGRSFTGMYSVPFQICKVSRL